MYIKTMIFLMVMYLSICAQSINYEIVKVNGHEAIKDEIIIKFKHSTTKIKQNQIFVDRQNILTKRGGEVKKIYKMGAEHWKLSNVDLEVLLQELNENEYVEYAEPNYILKADGIVPNDPRFNEQWGLNNTGQNGGVNDADIDAPEAWEISSDISEVLVGVLDSGIDYLHEDLKDNVWTNKNEIPGNGIDDDNNGYIDDIHGWDFINSDNDPMDDLGHGTNVAGIIAAKTNNNLGISGVASNVKLIPFKILDDEGNGYVSIIIEALEYCIKNDIFITNNSYGGTAFSAAMYDFFKDYSNYNFIFVSASGNKNSDNDLIPHYPSSYQSEKIISVGAYNRFNQKASFSNYGATSVDLFAPGKEILSTDLNDNYKIVDGTSFACPMVTGSVAMFKGKFPELNYNQIISQTFNSVKVIDELIGLCKTGGTINLFNGLNDDLSIEFDVDRTAINFPTIKIGTESDSSITILNTSNHAINIDSITTSSSFYINNNYVNKIENIIIEPNSSFEYKVIFSPINQGIFDSKCYIYYEKNNKNFYLAIDLKGVCINEGSSISGEISGVLTKENSPYYVSGDLIVPRGELLQIEEGVKLYFVDYYKIFVRSNGSIKALGSEDNPIEFLPLNVINGWGGIRFFDEQVSDGFEESVFDYCYFNGAKKINSMGGGGSRDEYQGAVMYGLNMSKIRITNCHFFSNSISAFGNGGVLYLYSTEDILLSNNEFKDNVGGCVDLSSAGIMIVNDNYFSGNHGVTLSLHSKDGTVLFVKNILVNNGGWNCAIGGLIVSSAKLFMLNNSIVYNNNYGLKLDNGVEAYIRNNIIYGNTNGQIVINDPFTYDFNNNCISENIGQNTILEDPLFKLAPDGRDLILPQLILI